MFAQQLDETFGGVVRQRDHLRPGARRAQHLDATRHIARRADEHHGLGSALRHLGRELAEIRFFAGKFLQHQGFEVRILKPRFLS